MLKKPGSVPTALRLGTHTQIIVYLPCAGLGFFYLDANIAWIMVFMTRNHSEVLKLILNTL